MNRLIWVGNTLISVSDALATIGVFAVIFITFALLLKSRK